MKIINFGASFFLAIYYLVIYVACRKNIHPDDQSDTTSWTISPNPADSTNSRKDTLTDSIFNTNNLVVNSTTCANAPRYGDSIVYLKPTSGGDFFAKPVNNIGIEGTYFSWPEGLKLNRNTGAINLSQGETGVRYNIAFIKKGATDTCVSQLIVGGLTYIDAIYDLSQGDTLAKPVFNANPFASSICDSSDDSDYPDNRENGNNKCVFDDDLPGHRANDQKLRVRTKSGIINLKKSVEEGLFGTNPKNGTSKLVQIRYRLNDASLNAAQKISVKVVYYDNLSGIPNTMRKEINSKRTDMLNYKIINGKPRPPLIIIAGLRK